MVLFHPVSLVQRVQSHSGESWQWSGHAAHTGWPRGSLPPPEFPLLPVPFRTQHVDVADVHAVAR